MHMHHYYQAQAGCLCVIAGLIPHDHERHVLDGACAPLDAPADGPVSPLATLPLQHRSLAPMTASLTFPGLAESAQLLWSSLHLSFVPLCLLCSALDRGGLHHGISLGLWSQLPVFDLTLLQVARKRTALSDTVASLGNQATRGLALLSLQQGNVFEEVGPLVCARKAHCVQMQDADWKNTVEQCITTIRDFMEARCGVCMHGDSGLNGTGAGSRFHVGAREPWARLQCTAI
jgi:hypothetical protein